MLKLILDRWYNVCIGFKWSVEIPLLNTKLLKLGYEFVVKIFVSKTKDPDDAKFAGQTRIAWNKCYELPRQTAVFDQFELGDPHKIAEVKPVKGMNKN